MPTLLAAAGMISRCPLVMLMPALPLVGLKVMSPVIVPPVSDRLLSLTVLTALAVAAKVVEVESTAEDSCTMPAALVEAEGTPVSCA